VFGRSSVSRYDVGLFHGRNDLDDQLFGQFQRCHEILRQTPVQADSVEHLRKLLNVASGGVVLTPARPRLVGLSPALRAVYVGRPHRPPFITIQKFMPEEKGGKAPELWKRRNIIVIADEAHRSQYDLIDGLARNLRDSLPSASFIGFTGTPIEKTDANTRAVFGDYISIYDIQRAVADKATVPIYYESRVAKLVEILHEVRNRAVA
jgi:type I restriction enzyme R subunit